MKVAFRIPLHELSFDQQDHLIDSMEGKEYSQAVDFHEHRKLIAIYIKGQQREKDKFQKKLIKLGWKETGKIDRYGKSFYSIPIDFSLFLKLTMGNEFYCIIDL